MKFGMWIFFLYNGVVAVITCNSPSPSSSMVPSADTWMSARVFSTFFQSGNFSTHCRVKVTTPVGTEHKTEKPHYIKQFSVLKLLFYIDYNTVKHNIIINGAEIVWFGGCMTKQESRVPVKIQQYCGEIWKHFCVHF